MGQFRQVARIMANHSHGKRGGDRSCAAMTGIESLKWGNLVNSTYILGLRVVRSVNVVVTYIRFLSVL